MEDVSPETRTFLIGSIALSTATWNLAFNLGAYRTVFFNEIFLAWVAVTAILLAVILIPDKKIPIPWWGILLMAVPTLAVVLQIANQEGKLDIISDWVLVAINAFAFLICLPYALYVAANIANADLLQLPNRRLRISLIVIVITVGLAGYWIGANNDLLLNCGDFKISGNDQPTNCQQGPPLQF
jgi:hypothetical protein